MSAPEAANEVGRVVVPDSGPNSLDALVRLYQEVAAEGLITFEELRAKLAGLDESREAARRELAALQTQKERLEELERDRGALLESYAAMVPEALQDLTGEERRTLYRMLQLQVVATPEGYEATGVLCSTEPTRRAM